MMRGGAFGPKVGLYFLSEWAAGLQWAYGASRVTAPDARRTWRGESRRSLSLPLWQHLGDGRWEEEDGLAGNQEVCGLAGARDTRFAAIRVGDVYTPARRGTQDPTASSGTTER